MGDVFDRGTGVRPGTSAPPKGGNVEADIKTRKLLRNQAANQINPVNPLRDIAKGKKIVEVGPDSPLYEEDK